jgi:hypothetical protein
MLRPHTGAVCSDHLGTLHSGCSRERKSDISLASSLADLNSSRGIR